MNWTVTTNPTKVPTTKTRDPWYAFQNRVRPDVGAVRGYRYRFDGRNLSMPIYSDSFQETGYCYPPSTIQDTPWMEHEQKT
jgi:hypothetical protein